MLAALAFPALGLAGCYIIPIGPDGQPYYAMVPGPVPPPGHVVVAPGVPGGPAPAVLNARLYPANDAATQIGMLSGTVTNMMTGKGRFQLDFRGEILTGEATRVSGEERKGVASAYGPRGTYMSCEYQMNTPYQGAGTCVLSSGAKYSVHIGG